MVFSLEKVLFVFVDASNNACIHQHVYSYNNRSELVTFVHHDLKNDHQNQWNSQAV